MADTSNLLIADELRLRGPDALTRVFARYNIKKKDIIRFRKLMERGKFEEVIDLFNDFYMIPPAQLYEDIIQRHLRTANSGQMPRGDQRRMSTSVVFMTGVATSLFINNFRQVMQGITQAPLQKQILDATLGEFTDLTRGAMSRTQTDVLSMVRRMQLEMITQNQKIALLTENGATSAAIDREVAQFRRRLQSSFPEYFKAMDDGLILKSRPFGSPPRVRRFKLDHYVELSTQTTIMNVERTSTEVTARSQDVPVVEYKLIDTRRLKGRAREICQSILNKKILGRSLLALDVNTSRKLGILTTDEARGSQAMGVLCRHGLKIPSKTFLRRLAKEFNLPRAKPVEEREEVA